jgi:hypothetical protein
MKYAICMIVLCLWSVNPASGNPGSGPVRVIVFLSPVCPVCQYYALPLREMHAEFSSEKIRFEGRVPGKLFSDGELADFSRKYRIPFPVVADAEGLHYALGATITPEVFVLGPDDRVLYSGRIDNAYAAVGRKRPKATLHELRTVLEQIASGEAPDVIRQPAVGCLITK